MTQSTDLCEPASHGGFLSHLHRNGAAGLDLQNVLQNSDPLLQDIGGVSGQEKGRLLCNQLIRLKTDRKNQGEVLKTTSEISIRFC